MVGVLGGRGRLGGDLCGFRAKVAASGAWGGGAGCLGFGFRAQVPKPLKSGPQTSGSKSVNIIFEQTCKVSLALYPP